MNVCPKCGAKLFWVFTLPSFRGAICPKCDRPPKQEGSP